MYHSPRIQHANTAINHYYPDRTHSRNVPHSSPSRLASRRDSFIHACSSPLAIPRESARGCLSTPPSSAYPRLYIIISQWTIFCCFSLLIAPDDSSFFFYDTCGNNLKLRNHSRELITGPRACLLARCFLATSSPCSRCTPLNMQLSSSGWFSSRRKRETSAFLSPLSFSLDFFITLASPFSRSQSKLTTFLFFGVFASTATTTTNRAVCSPPLLRLLRTDCYVFLSYKQARSPIPASDTMATLSIILALVCFPVLPSRNFPSDSCSMYARDSSHPLSRP